MVPDHGFVQQGPCSLLLNTINTNINNLSKDLQKYSVTTKDVVQRALPR